MHIGVGRGLVWVWGVVFGVEFGSFSFVLVHFSCVFDAFLSIVFGTLFAFGDFVNANDSP